MEPEIVIASSPADGDIICWDLRGGAELLQFKSCSSPPHGLTCIAGRFLASSQLRNSKHSSSGSIFYWSWNKPQVGVKSFPAEPIGPLVSNSEGTYVAGGGVSGDIYFWEVATGRLLKKWHAHYRGVTCLVFNDDQSLLVSGAEDGCVRVWSLFSMLNDMTREEARSPYMYSFHEHSLKVTDIKTGHGGCNAIIVTASEDHTCKVWSLSNGELLGNIPFPSIIEAIVLEPAETVIYAGCRDGEIYIVGSRSPVASNSSPGLQIIGSLSGHRKAVTCLASSADGFLLISGSEDGTIQVWDTKKRTIIRTSKHTKGSVNNVLVIRRTKFINSQKLPHPLEKYANSADENVYAKVHISPHDNFDEFVDSSYISVQTMEKLIKELERQGSSEAHDAKLEMLISEQQKSVQLIQQYERSYKKLHQFCVEEILDGGLTEGADNPQI